MNKILLVFIALSFNGCFSASIVVKPDLETTELAVAYNKQARDWIEQFVIDKDGHLIVSEEELTFINNFLYFSFAYSYVARLVQERTLKLFADSWSLWHEVAQNQSSKTNGNELAEAYDELSAILPFYHTMCTRHVYLTKGIDKLSNVHMSRAKQAIESLRNQSQFAAFGGLLDIRKYVFELAAYVDESLDDHSKGEKRRSIRGNRLLRWLANFAAQCTQGAMMKADGLAKRLSYDLWHIMHVIQKIRGRILNTIETARSTLYYAYYSELNKTCEAHSIAGFYRELLCDEIESSLDDCQLKTLPLCTDLS